MTSRTSPFTGRHMAAICVVGFGVVIAVNLTMATLASTTFGGVVVENSYLASQDFNRWLDEAAKEKALAGRITAHRRGDGHVVARLDGPPATAITATARHPLGRLPDIALEFGEQAGGEWVSAQALPAGRWTLRFDVVAPGRNWRVEEPLGAGDVQ